MLIFFGLPVFSILQNLAFHTFGSHASSSPANIKITFFLFFQLEITKTAVILSASTKQGCIAQLVRASRCHREGHWFESSYTHHFQNSPPTGLLVGFFVSGVNLSSTRVLPESGESPLFSYEGVFQPLSR